MVVPEGGIWNFSVFYLAYNYERCRHEHSRYRHYYCRQHRWSTGNKVPTKRTRDSNTWKKMIYEFCFEKKKEELLPPAATNATIASAAAAEAAFATTVKVALSPSRLIVSCSRSRPTQHRRQWRWQLAKDGKEDPADIERWIWEWKVLDWRT